MSEVVAAAPAPGITNGVVTTDVVPPTVLSAQEYLGTEIYPYLNAALESLLSVRPADPVTYLAVTMKQLQDEEIKARIIATAAYVERQRVRQEVAAEQQVKQRV